MLKYPTEERFFQITVNSHDDNTLESAFTPLPAGGPLKLGRVADWTGQLDGHHGHGGHGGSGQHGPGGQHASVVSGNAKGRSVDGWNVKRVVLPPSTTSSNSNKKTMRSSHPAASATSNQSRLPGSSGGGGGNRPLGGSGGGNRGTPLTTNREPSVTVGAGWRLVEEIEMSRLSKLTALPDCEAGSILQPGTLTPYDRQLDRLTCKQEKRLPAGKPSAEGRVKNNEASETSERVRAECEVQAAALLMACDRTVMPWHLQVEVGEGGRVRLSGTAPAWVGEGSWEAPSDDAMHQLATEAAQVQSSLLSLLLLLPLPLPTSDPAANDAAGNERVVDWRLSQSLTVRVRASQSSSLLVQAAGEEACLLRPLLETEPRAGLEWRQRLDQQRGAVLAAELKLNYALLSRTIYAATLLEIPTLRLAFCSRQLARDATRHSLLGMAVFTPEELASQMSLTVEHGWGILRALLERLATLPVGRYCLARDPNKALLRLYQL